jgi:hypothetical protein
VLITLIGSVPLLGGLLVRYTSFADTPAENAWKLERGDTGAEAIAQKVLHRVAEDKAAFGELFALGTFELKRGKLDLAITHLKAALIKTPDEPHAQVNLGVAMFLSGDLENPRSLFETAGACSTSVGCQGQPTSGKLSGEAAPWLDLARLHQRRVQVFGLEQASAEIDLGNAALGEARGRAQGALNDLPDGFPDKASGNTLLMTVPMAREDLLALAESPESEARVRSQLSLMLLGDFKQPWAPFYPIAACLLLVAFGALGARLGTARACMKCGSPLSKRDDPAITNSSVMCTQCVNVFSKKGVVPAQLKVLKQIEVARYQSRMDRLSFALGLVCSGMGHVFKGQSVRGTVYGFLFLFGLTAVALRDGVLRAPFEGLPPWVKVVPFGLMLLLVWVLSMRALVRKQGA